jgi:prevent-host-death family protein
MTTTTVNITEAKARFSRLLAEVEAGGEVIITRHGQVIAKVVAISSAPRARVFGFGVGMGTLRDDWDTPDFTDEELDEWENSL